MKNERGIGLFDRRKGNDRRCWYCSYDYPFIDSHGMLVTEDRRKMLDRRVEHPSFAYAQQGAN